MVPAGNKAKRLSSVKHTTKTTHHHHYHHHHKCLQILIWFWLKVSMKIWVKKSSFKNFNINWSFVNDINTKLSNLEEKFSEFWSKYKVNSKLQQCKIFNSHLLTRIIQLEHNGVANSQYSRRETIEFIVRTPRFLRGGEWILNTSPGGGDLKN